MRLEAHLTTIGTFGGGVRGETGSTSDYHRCTNESRSKNPPTSTVVMYAL